MPVDHIVLLKVKSSVTKEEVTRLIDGLQQFKSIPGVLDVKIGVHSTTLYSDYKDRSKGFTHIFTVTLKDAAALELYSTHAIHERVRQTAIIPVIEDIQAMDYYFESSNSAAHNKSGAAAASAASAASAAAAPIELDSVPAISGWLKGGIVLGAVTGVAFALKSILGDGTPTIPVTAPKL